MSQARPATLSQSLKLKSLDDVDAALHELGWLTHQTQVIDGRTQTAIAALQQAAAGKLQVEIDGQAVTFADRSQQLREALERWCEASLAQHLPAGAKSLTLAHGKVGRRELPAAVAFTTTGHAAEHLQVSWDTVRDIEARHLQQTSAKPKLKHLRHIAIDEIYLGQSVKFLTVVLDLESGAIVFVGRGKGAEALDPFWKRLRHSRALIEAVAADMSPAYALAVRTHLPHATLVNDRFHVIKLYNEMLTELRRELYREATTQLARDVLKGTRWLLLKSLNNLDEDRDEPGRLLQALQLNQSLAVAYYLKDDLNELWEQPDKRAAGRWLDQWLAAANTSGIRLLQKFAKTLASRRQSLLAWYDYPISTGPLEAVNNKIRLLQRQAFGYRDFEFFRLKLYALHRMRYALVG